ncbi:hypothetical protein PPSIR1_04088 [Plesiocystis pacifica SIR-1]|uniref:Uncharacterized protein n=1 Tax=Plesiocystis pacifica SIR-1 TaxID=391625 RepID=A6G4H6_9BACT|nr:hypothetical protein PPSIR1_04088 [Plesiocystis pacifica SIR-1]
MALCGPQLTMRINDARAQVPLD